METKNIDIQAIKLQYLVEEMKNKYMDLWWNTGSEFPPLTKKYSFFEKKHIEKEIDKFIDKLSNKLKAIPESKANIEKWQNEIFMDIKSFAMNTLKLNKKHLDIIFSDGYSNVTNEFIKRARQFDSKIDVFDIFQAIRNVWIANSLQIFIGKKIEFTEAIFAYSMLYPYTDNYLDDPDCSIDEKLKFNQNFRNRLAGSLKKACNKNEEDIFKLIELIEAQYDRSTFEKVYESLIAIHDAQNKSLTQQKGIMSPYEKDILGISFEKGGTSVLADGYLVNGDLCFEQAMFAFGYGVFLQLADDLQDMQEDLRNGHMTVFSSLASKWMLDGITNRLFYFMKAILDAADFKEQNAAELRCIIEFSCGYLILGAVSKNKKYFSRAYIKKMQQYSLTSFSYLKKFEKKLKKKFSPIDISNISSALEFLNN